MPGVFAGFHQLIENEALKRPIKRGISVGCGAAQKELGLVKAGIVAQFDLVEISEVRIAAGKDRARSLGISDRAHFILSEDYASITDCYDLVYWNNSLHHMMDTAQAIRWSREKLRQGGIFAMDEYVGPTRFQWTDRNIEYANLFRRYLKPEQLVDPRNPSKPIAPIARPTIERMMALDPSEAADSDSIIPSILEIFPNAFLAFTGGAIYHLCLNDVLTNLDEGGSELAAALALDDALSHMGENHYAVALQRV